MREHIAEICYQAAEKFFNFEKDPLQIFESKEKSKKCVSFLEKNVNSDDDAFYSQLIRNFTIRLIILTNKGKQEYGREGLDFFVLCKNGNFFYHSNASRVTKLPAGVGKLNKPIHRLDSIIFAINKRKIKCESCPLFDHCDFGKLEKQYKINFEIWSKSKIKDKFSFVKLRNCSRNSWPVAKLHFDKTTGRYFLIRDTSLYFRGSLKRLRNERLI